MNASRLTEGAGIRRVLRFLRPTSVAQCSSQSTRANIFKMTEEEQTEHDDIPSQCLVEAVTPEDSDLGNDYIPEHRPDIR